MLRHEDIWRAIDRLAERHGLSASGMARKAGLDPTAFNKSKRETPDGRMRWPSTESIAKILEATGSSLGDFVGLLQEGGGALSIRLPALELGEAVMTRAFDAQGFPVEAVWRRTVFPDVADGQVYALYIPDTTFEPVYRLGSWVVVSPNHSVRRGDRVAVKFRDGRLSLMELARHTAHSIELRTLSADRAQAVFHPQDIAWMSRIVWAGQ